LGNDLWSASFMPTGTGRHVFEIEAWWDLFGTYRDELYKKHHAGVPVTLELEEGRQLVARILEQANDDARRAVEDVYDRLQASDSESGRVAILLDNETRRAMEAAEAHPHLVRTDIQLPVEVDRPKALYSSWYELFPRSETDD